jgi:hypothetical protein
MAEDVIRHTFNVSIAVGIGMPLNLKEIEKIKAREELGNQLIAFLLKNKEETYAVETKEHIVKKDETHDSYIIYCSLVPTHSEEAKILYMK